jgi:hypothetical protein
MYLCTPIYLPETIKEQSMKRTTTMLLLAAVMCMFTACTPLGTSLLTQGNENGSIVNNLQQATGNTLQNYIGQANGISNNVPVQDNQGNANNGFTLGNTNAGQNVNNQNVQNAANSTLSGIIGTVTNTTNGVSTSNKNGTGITCPTCKGTGKCTACNGKTTTATTTNKKNSSNKNTKCSTCNNTYKCTTCSGKGTITYNNNSNKKK